MIKIKTALLSVYDKTGILELAKYLTENNVGGVFGNKKNKKDKKKN